MTQIDTMTEIAYALPPSPRGLLRLSGPDRVSFLQGIVSNDIKKARPGHAVWATLLTAQGKYLHDFFVIADGETLLLDAEGERLADLQRRLTLYKLRAKVTIAPVTDLVVRLGWGTALPEAAEGALIVQDPRLAELGIRIVAPADWQAPAGLTAGDSADWDRLRLALGVPDGSRDLTTEKSILLENGFDELHGIAWDKGCYVGQELTARTKYRGLVKKRLLPVAFDGPAPTPGTIIMQNGAEAGEMRSGRDGIGLGLIRLEALKSDADMTAGGMRVTPRPPAWFMPPA
jgi:folate-binding protein YgfZ